MVCPHKKSPEQIHTIAAEPDDALESSGEDNVLILAQVDEVFNSSTTTATPGSQRPPTQEGFFFMQDTATPTCHPISSDLLLLDSQSTVHLFSQPEHVDNIRPATTPICVHCNKGTLETTQEADFGHTLNYFDARGIANVLSLYQLGQKFKVMYDSTDRKGSSRFSLLKQWSSSHPLLRVSMLLISGTTLKPHSFLSIMLILPLVILR